MFSVLPMSENWELGSDEERGTIYWKGLFESQCPFDIVNNRCCIKIDAEFISYSDYDQPTELNQSACESLEYCKKSIQIRYLVAYCRLLLLPRPFY